MSVRRRHVLFLAGFDPKGAAYYHGLYRREAPKQAVLEGPDCEVGPRVRLPGGNQAWQVLARDPTSGETTHTTVEHVRWDDVVRREWPTSFWGIASGMCMAYWHTITFDKTLPKVWRATPRTLLALAWPGLCWLSVLLGALALGLGAAAALTAVWPAVFGAGLAALVGAALSWLTLWGAWQLEKRWNTAWLMRIFRFADRWSRARLPAWDARIDQMTQRLEEVLADPELDEVLLVGFSVGSMLGVSILSRLQRAAPSKARPTLSFLSLGQCIPLLGLMRQSHAFRAELARVADAEELFWVDVSSPTDWGSFALADPVQLCLERRALNPRAMTSPRFHTLFDPERYLLLRRDKRRIHLQYLMAGERGGGYNFFDITAGPKRLMEHPWTPAQPPRP